jgi:hypothetical protein
MSDLDQGYIEVSLWANDGEYDCIAVPINNPVALEQQITAFKADWVNTPDMVAIYLRRHDHAPQECECRQYELDSHPYWTNGVTTPFVEQ